MSNITEISSYPYVTGMSLHQIQLDLNREKEIFKQKIDQLEISNKDGDLDIRKIESINKKLSNITLLFKETLNPLNSVKKAESLFNLLREYQRVNEEMSEVLDADR
jgi:hypothetical protein